MFVSKTKGTRFKSSVARQNKYKQMWGRSSCGRALALQAWGSGFKSHRFHQILLDVAIEKCDANEGLKSINDNNNIVCDNGAGFEFIKSFNNGYSSVVDVVLFRYWNVGC